MKQIQHNKGVDRWIKTYPVGNANRNLMWKTKDNEHILILLNGVKLHDEAMRFWHN